MRISDWSSDVCSSDLIGRVAQRESTAFTRQGSLVQSQPRPPSKLLKKDNKSDQWSAALPRHSGRVTTMSPPGVLWLWHARHRRPGADRKSVVEGKRGSVRVDPGGRRILKKKKK